MLRRTKYSVKFSFANKRWHWRNLWVSKGLKVKTRLGAWPFHKFPHALRWLPLNGESKVQGRESEEISIIYYAEGWLATEPSLAYPCRSKTGCEEPAACSFSNSTISTEQDFSPVEIYGCVRECLWVRVCLHVALNYLCVPATANLVAQKAIKAHMQS